MPELRIPRMSVPLHSVDQSRYRPQLRFEEGVASMLRKGEISWSCAEDGLPLPILKS
jgi:hypothetical protein